MLINLVNNVSFERYVPKKDASSDRPAVAVARMIARENCKSSES